MSKTGIRISNTLGTVTNEYDSRDLRVTIIEPSGAEVIAYHTEGQVDTAKLAQGNVAAGSSASTAGLLGGGSGGYAGGGVGGAAPESAQTMQVADIAFIPGGITRVPYPTGSQKRYRLTGVVAGLGALAFTVSGSKPGVGRFSIVGAETDSCPLDDAAIGTEAGVFVGPSIIQPYGQSNHFSAHFQVHKNDAGFGPVVPVDKPTFVNVKFGTGVPSNLTVEIAAHDR